MRGIHATHNKARDEKPIKFASKDSYPTIVSYSLKLIELVLPSGIRNKVFTNNPTIVLPLDGAGNGCTPPKRCVAVLLVDLNRQRRAE